MVASSRSSVHKGGWHDAAPRKNTPLDESNHKRRWDNHRHASGGKFANTAAVIGRLARFDRPSVHSRPIKDNCLTAADTITA